MRDRRNNLPSPICPVRAFAVMTSRCQRDRDFDTEPGQEVQRIARDRFGSWRPLTSVAVMPWTPMAVSASHLVKLEGFDDRDNKFHGRPYYFILDISGADPPAARCECKSGIFLGKWHKKVAGERKNIRAGDIDHCTGGGQSAKMQFQLQPFGRPIRRLKGPGRKCRTNQWFYASSGQQQVYPEAQLATSLPGFSGFGLDRGDVGLQRRDIPQVPGGSPLPPSPAPPVARPRLQPAAT